MPIDFAQIKSVTYYARHTYHSIRMTTAPRATIIMQDGSKITLHDDEAETFHQQHEEYKLETRYDHTNPATAAPRADLRP